MLACLLDKYIHLFLLILFWPLDLIAKNGSLYCTCLFCLLQGLVTALPIVSVQLKEQYFKYFQQMNRAIMLYMIRISNGQNKEGHEWSFSWRFHEVVNMLHKNKIGEVVISKINQIPENVKKEVRDAFCDKAEGCRTEIQLKTKSRHFTLLYIMY